jgi:two-component sensor histidine kinase
MAILHAQKNQIEQTINNFFDEFVRRIEAMTLTDSRLYELERREEKIIKGSIKSVIQHYS